MIEEIKTVLVDIMFYVLRSGNANIEIVIGI